VFISTYTPNQEVRFFFFNVKLKYLAMSFVFLDVIQIPNGNAGGHLAHLGGAYLGFLYASQLQKGRDIGSSWGAFWERFGKMFQSRPNLKKVYKNPTPKTRKTASVNQQKIDTILDKISTSGYDSLTKEEKDILFQAGKE
jgi:hypothetical protein